jgi:hypothetical protein
VALAVDVVILEWDFAGALVRLTNSNGVEAWLPAGAKIVGTAVTGGQVLEVEAMDQAADTDYGGRVLVLDALEIDDAEDANNLALWLRGRFGRARGWMIEAQTDSADVALMDRVTIADSQTDHDSDYIVVGLGGHVVGLIYRARLILEAAEALAFAVLGVSRLDDDGCRLAY